MDSEQHQSGTGLSIWGGGVVGGLVGGIAMGLVLHLGANQIHLFGALVGDPTVLTGWIVHLTFSVVFGLVFATLVSSVVVDTVIGTFSDYVVSGLAYGSILGLFSGGFLLPLSLSQLGAVTYPAPFLPLPGIGGELLFALLLAIAHLVYGVTIGGVYATINGSAPAVVTDRIPVLEQ